MASRVAGAVFAVIAAALLAGSVLLVPWWSGHPTFKGVAIKAKEITVGPLGGTGCNVGGDGACMNVPVDPTFEIAGLALAGVTALLVLVAAVMATLALIGRDGRRTFAVFTIIGAAIAGGLGGALLAIGPQIQTEAPLPFALGLYVFFGGIACAFVGSLLALRKDAPARMQLAPARQSAKQLQNSSAPHRSADQHPPPVDMRALLAEDSLRPSSLGPEPMLGKPPPVQSPGGALPGPSGPLGAIGTNNPQPLFSSAPQLRPLYELQGGGIAKPQANFPLRPPTPIPRDQVSAMAGIPTPASIDVQRPVTAAGIPAAPPPPPSPPVPPPLPPPTPVPRATPKPPTPPPPLGEPHEPGLETDRDLLGTARASKPRTLPPPNRNKPPSVAPMAPFVAMPARPDTEHDDDDSFDALKTYDANRRPAAAERPKPPTPGPRNSPFPAAPPKWSATSPSPKSPAAAAPPSSPAAWAPSKLPGRSPPESPASALPNPAPSAPSRSPTGPAPQSPATSALSTSAPSALSSSHGASPSSTPSTSEPSKSHAPSAPARLLTEDAPLDTDLSTHAIDENLPSTEAFERPKTVTSTMETQSAPPGDDDDDELMTTARDKVSSTDVEGLPTVRPPTATEMHSPAPTASEPPTEREKPKPPISTAPQSLPPPTEKQQVTSGPSPACPQCEAPMAWVEAHLRFYCKSCKMYF